MVGDTFRQRELDPGMVGAELRKKAHEPHWPDRTHDSELERRVVEFQKPPRGRLDGFGTPQDLPELRADELAEIGEMRAASLASEEQPAKLLLDLLDRPCQRWLGHVRALGGSGEIQCLAYRQEIADLVHLHGGLPRFPNDAQIHQSSDASALSPIHRLSQPPSARLLAGRGLLERGLVIDVVHPKPRT